MIVGEVTCQKPRTYGLNPSPEARLAGRRAVPSAGSEPRSGVLNRRASGSHTEAVSYAVGPCFLDGKPGGAERATRRRASPLQRDMSSNTAPLSQRDHSGRSRPRAENGCNEGGAGRSILELPGPNHRTGKASVSNAPRASPGDDRPDFRRGIHAAGTPIGTQRSTAIAKPAGSDSHLPKRRAVANSPGEAMPPGPAKTDAPDARSGARKALPKRIHVRLTPFTVQKPCSAHHFESAVTYDHPRSLK